MDDRNAPYFVHPKAICESSDVGTDSRIWAFSHVMRGARIGADCNLGENVFVENAVTIGDRCTIKNGVAIWDHVTLEDDVFLGPSVVLTNDMRPRAFFRGETFLPTPTRICRGASVGANATIVCGVTIGEFAMIGAGSVVHRDVPAHAIVVGNPARIIGRACICGQKLDPADFCGACGVCLGENSVEHAITSRVFSQRKTHGEDQGAGDDPGGHAVS